MIRAALALVADAVMPPLCAGCGAEQTTDGVLCARCWGRVPWLAGPGCLRCGLDVAGLGRDERFVCDGCLRHARCWSEGRAVFLYRDLGRRLVLGLKHGDRLDTAPMLARWMVARARGLLDAADWVVPVPLHWTRRLRRRFNQAEELARRMAAAGPATVRTDLLRRVRRTTSQGRLGREARRANLAGALRVPAQVASTLAGRRILLVDDVMTSGATLDAAAAALLGAGAARVDVAVLALVPPPEGTYLGRNSRAGEAAVADEDNPKVEIYTSPFCGYCFMAKRLLGRKGVAFREVSVLGDAGARAEMVQRANGRTTVPQIFIDGEHVGGSDELHALEREGRLDPMLGLA